mgnify:CR=1 FL=1
MPLLAHWFAEKNALVDAVNENFAYPSKALWMDSSLATLGSHHEKTVHMIFDVLKKNALYFCENVMTLAENPENELRL